jgi:hypothetical protein
MSDNNYNSNSSSNDNSAEKLIVPVWELLFDDKKEGDINNMVLESLLHKKIKVWSVLAMTVNGIRGTYKGQVGVLTSFDDEFIVLDNQYILSRKFIFRIEPESN